MFERYVRHTILKEIGTDQKKLSEGSVAIVGLGGLGSNSSNLLVRAGIGKIILIDRDYVELDNLQRQVLFDENDIGMPKAIAAKNHLEKINSDVEVKAYAEDLNWKNAERLIENVDIILDGTDNLETRFLINDVSVKHDIPWIYAACIGTEGISFNVVPGGPCFRCIIPRLSRPGSLETCETRGILNSVPMLVSARQVTETIKILLNKQYSRKLFSVDLWKNKFELLGVQKNNSCETCENRNFEFLEGRKGSSALKMCGRNTFQIRLTGKPEKFEKLSTRLKEIGEVCLNEYVFHFSVGGKKLSLFKDGRVIIKGVRAEREARIFCSKYIGN